MGLSWTQLVFLHEFYGVITWKVKTSKTRTSHMQSHRTLSTSLKKVGWKKRLSSAGVREWYDLKPAKSVRTYLFSNASGGHRSTNSSWKKSDEFECSPCRQRLPAIRRTFAEAERWQKIRFDLFDTIRFVFCFTQPCYRKVLYEMNCRNRFNSNIVFFFYRTSTNITFLRTIGPWQSKETHVNSRVEDYVTPHNLLRTHNLVEDNQDTWFNHTHTLTRFRVF